ncbi:MAG: SUMF1/EgtB/PvdO family nonheme iron enzyme [Saprospiraceae bacterium]
MKFKLIPAGSFILGEYQPTVSMVGYFSEEAEPKDNPIFENAKVLAQKAYLNGREIRMSKSYYIGVFEVTQQEWKSIMGGNPSTFNEANLHRPTDKFPVENISLKQIEKFIRVLNKNSKYKYRLPTEMEWEYASRAGNSNDISWPEIWKTAVIGKQIPHEIGSKAPNAWGLYDMLGNIWELTSDTYNEKLFADDNPTYNGRERVIKGSCFYGDVKNATYMTHAGASGSRNDVGIRLVLEFKK